jgi:hypothetical protein
MCFLTGVFMAKIKKIKLVNHTDHPFDNGAIGVTASVASAGVAVGAAVGAMTGPPGLLVGAAIGGAVATAGALAVAKEMDHPKSITPPKKTV